MMTSAQPTGAAMPTRFPSDEERWTAVVRGNGALGGNRWWVDRKRARIERETTP